MNDFERPSDVPPEEWVLDQVRRHLDAQADRVDPRFLFDRIRAEVQAPAPPVSLPSEQPPRRWLGLLLTLAASLGLVFLGSWLLAPVPSHASPSPRELVEATQQIHRLPVDRCYLVETQRKPAFQEVFPGVPLLQANRLWTRGDRFFFVPVEGRLGRAWGRDQNGNLWIAPTPRTGIRVESEEIPPQLAASLEMNTLRVDQLLSELLKNCELERINDSGDGLAATEIIRATPTRGRFAMMVCAATLEIDPETKVLRRLVVSRGPLDRPVVTTTYTLIETGTLDADRYSLEGHLREPHEILTREKQPLRRLEILRRMYGPMADRWFGPR